MSMRTVELVSEWDSVPFSGGFEGLQTLSDQGFSGAVTAGSAQLFMLNGTVVGILDGDIDAFDGADGTARAAPHDALPLLTVMQDRADSPRAQYYTEDTPISEVDATLSDGNFTGFVELSENVLSGDYYLVYHQGRSMSVAWVGSSEKLITDEEAFDQANGEVGIYKVMPAAIEPVELPDPPEPSDGGATAASAADDTSAASVAVEEDDDAPSAGAEEEPTGSVADRTTDDASTGAVTEETVPDDVATGSVSEESGKPSAAESSSETSERDRASAGPPGSKAAVGRDGADDTESTATASAESAASEPAGTDSTGQRTPEPSSTARQSSETTEGAEPADATATEPETPAIEPETTATAEPDTVGSGDAEPVQTESIPSLDPDRSRAPPESSSGATTSTQSVSTGSTTTPPQSANSPSGPAETATSEPSTTETEPTAAKTGPKTTERAPASTATEDASRSQESADIESTLEEREAEIERLETEIDELAEENEALASERDRLVSELEEARAEIRRLEEQLEAAGGAVTGSTQLSAAEAIDGTNLFIRYHSKGEATLEKAQDGNVDRSSVEENLRLEYHTQFDGTDAVVDGTDFEAFLHDSIQYRFVDWLVRSLLYEIRDTGQASAMGVLYEALPKIDRAELNGQVSITYTEDGEKHRSQETFDVVVRDRMGNPLVVANINDSRQPATEGQMTNIVRDAERVGNVSDSLAAAFLVTSSFFEPEALETADEATSSGLFSRDKRKSFVNLSRKDGYHLCLLEARNREFHLAVPEL